MGSVEQRAEMLANMVEAAFLSSDPASRPAAIAAIAAALREQPEARGVVDDAIVERVARALAANDRPHRDPSEWWAGLDEEVRNIHRRRARVSITAAQQPVQEGGGQCSQLCMREMTCTNDCAPPSAPVGVDGCTESNCPRCLTHPDHRGDMAHAGIGGYPTQQPAQAAPDFCDVHCTWQDHAPGCPRHEGASAPVEVGMPAIWHRLGWAESAVPDDWRVLAREARESIETLWNAQHPAQAAPGWKLVPVEPTEAMLDSGCEQHECEQGDPYYRAPPLSEGDARAIYAAMLAAAPTPPGDDAAGGGLHG